MKGDSNPVQTESYNEGNTTASNDSDDERDKLVIDLDANNMSNNTADNKTQGKGSSGEEPMAEDSVTLNTKNSNEQPTAGNNSKNGRAENNASLVKPKGKRGGQKKSGDNANKTEALSNTATKPAGKIAKPEKEKTTGGKPGRKKKEKLSPTPVKNEPSIKIEGNMEDPYKFDPNDEKIASTVMGKNSNKIKIKSEPKACKDAQTEYDWRSIAILTEPENLGPCEPGTQVCLEGIVWQETNNGVLVVNVTWKGKTYMGTLLDATKHDWSPPSCDSPTGDFEGRTPKGRGKRSRVPLSDTFKDINERKLRKEMRKQSNQNKARSKSPASPKSENGKRKGRSSECDNSEPVTKRGRGTSSNPSAMSPPTLISCPEPNCGKKYKQMNGLRYHQRNAHPEGSPQVSSDTTSEGMDKGETISSPEEMKAKNIGSNKKSETAEFENKSISKSDTTITDSPPKSSLKSNTTSVITPTTNNLTTSSIPQSSNVPVATITPQIVKPSSDNEQIRSNSSNSTLTSTSNRTVAITAPPKLISKPNVNSSSMAPISTITSPAAYNSSLKPIQPKPTILGEVTPNPALHDLMDQKKFKRRRSASKEDLVNSSGYSISDSQKTSNGGSGMHKFDAEHRGLLSAGGMINSSEPSNSLQSPSYSDISEEGEIKNAAARREFSSVCKNESNMYSQPSYLVATVSPQKNAPHISDKDSKKPLNSHTPTHSPVPSRGNDDKQMKPIPQYFSPNSPWAISPEFLHMQMQMQNGASKDKSSNRTLSPKPNSYKNSGALPLSNRETDSRASNDRLQLLKENMDVKASSVISRHGMHDTPHDYSLSPSNSSQQSNDIMKSFQDQKTRDMEHDHHKREMIKNLSPAGKMQSSSSSTSKQAENRYDKMPRSSPMPPPGTFPPPFMSNPLFSFLPGAIPGAMLPRAMPGMFPGVPYGNLPNMPIDGKDASGNTVAASYAAKSGHKIHELADGMQPSKSPRPSSSGDRQLSTKNQTITPQSVAFNASTAAAAMLRTLGAPPGFNPGMAGLFEPPK